MRESCLLSTIIAYIFQCGWQCKFIKTVNVMFTLKFTDRDIVPTLNFSAPSIQNPTAML